MTENGLRQYNALTESKPLSHKWVANADGTQAQSALIEKLLLLCAIKTATLDAGGMGIEMEGGKPGWYDALNGLPGLLGSSMAETCELLRLVRFTRSTLERYGGGVEPYDEIAELIAGVTGVIGGTDDLFARWDKLNNLKENYRTATAKGFNGSRQVVSPNELISALNVMETALSDGIKAAIGYGGGILPTYFTFEAEEITDTPDGPMPKKLKPCPLPLFLEGPMHLLKLSVPTEEKRTIVGKIKNSGLYDNELKMYKVKENLGHVSFEAGRVKHFDSLRAARKLWPDKELWFTEGCVEYGRFGGMSDIDKAEMYAHDILGNLNAGICGSIDWNLLLDAKGGPNHAGNFCEAPIMLTDDGSDFVLQSEYYYIGHFSRFIRPGAVCLAASSWGPNAEVTAFENTDGSRVLIALNRTDSSITLSVTEGGDNAVNFELSAHSAVTMLMF